MSDETDESDRQAEESDSEETDSGADAELEDGPPKIEFEPGADDGPDSFADLGESLAEDRDDGGDAGSDDSDRDDSDETADGSSDGDTDDSGGFGSDLAAEVAEDFGEESFDPDSLPDDRERHDSVGDPAADPAPEPNEVSESDEVTAFTEMPESGDLSGQPDVFADPEHVSEGSDTTHEERAEVDTGETGAADGVPDRATADPMAGSADDTTADTDVTDSVSDESDDRTAPLSELADEIQSGAEAEVEDDPFFEEMDVTDADSDTAWDRLEEEDPFEQPDLDDGIEDVPEERDEHIVDKRKYCQQCEFLSEPPEVHCGHDGTEIVQVPDSEHFRVRSCPMIGEDGPNFDGASGEDDSEDDSDAADS